MRKIGPSSLKLFAFCFLSATLSSCSYYSASDNNESMGVPNSYGYSADYSARLPQHINTTEKVVVIDPHVHTWGAYNANGDLEKAGLATAGSNWCPDLGRPCHTKVGSFRVVSLGSEACKSSLFPIPHGGAPMPYCMFFNGNQALHGSHDPEVVEGNISHGCVRMHISDAEWLRFNFVNIGTKVIVRPY